MRRLKFCLRVWLTRWVWWKHARRKNHKSCLNKNVVTGASVYSPASPSCQTPADTTHAMRISCCDNDAYSERCTQLEAPKCRDQVARYNIYSKSDGYRWLIHACVSFCKKLALRQDASSISRTAQPTQKTDPLLAYRQRYCCLSLILTLENENKLITWSACTQWCSAPS